METRKSSKGEVLENEDSLIDAEIIDHLAESVLENVFVGLMFEMHRNIAINKLVGLREELLPDQARDETTDRERKADESQCVTPKGTTQRGKRSNGRSRGAAECKCKCFVCHQMIAAVRFAPHLEKCIGIGRAARSRRRGTTTNFMTAAAAFGDTDGAELASPSRSTRSSTLRSAARRMLSDDAAVATAGDAAPSLPTGPFLGRRRPPLVAEDFTLPPASTTVTDAKAMTKTLCATDVVLQNATIKVEEDEAIEEPLRDRLRNKNLSKK